MQMVEADSTAIFFKIISRKKGLRLRSGRAQKAQKLFVNFARPRPRPASGVAGVFFVANSFFLWLLYAFMVIGFSACNQESGPSPEDKAAVEKVITQFHRVLEASYQGKNVDLAGAIDKTFESDSRYVTYWGTEEPIDTTRARMLNGVGNVLDYSNAVENIESRLYGEGAVVSCIVRQEYMLQGHRVDEFLPTTYVLEKKEGNWKVVFTHRSADFQTISQQLEWTRQKNELGNAN